MFLHFSLDGFSSKNKFVIRKYNFAWGECKQAMMNIGVGMEASRSMRGGIGRNYSRSWSIKEITLPEEVCGGYLYIVKQQIKI